MAKIFQISTVLASPVILNDLGARSFTHPTVAYVLSSEYSLEEIRDSADLRAAIVAGDLTADFDGQAITDGATFDAAMVDFDTTQTQTNTGNITDLDTRVTSLEQGGRRRLSVIDYVDNTAVPPTEVLGDRYILDDTGASNAAWDGAAALSIVEFDGASWVEEVPLEGDKAYVDAEDQDRRYVDDGAGAWEVVTDTVKKSWTYSAGEDGNLNGSRDLQRTGSMSTNITPFIVPVAGVIYGITIGTDLAYTYDVEIFKNGVSAHTENVVAVDSKVNSGVGLAVAAGDKIRVRFTKLAANIANLGVEIYGVED